MPNRLVRRSIFVAAASLSVLVAGCGATGGADGGSTQIVSSAVAPRAQQAAGLVEAAQATGAVTTGRVSITVRTTPAGGDPSVTVNASGAIDGVNGRAHLTAEVGGTTGGRSGEAAIEAVYDGDTVYVKAPFTELLGDRPWVKVSSPKLADVAEGLGAGLYADPGSFVSLLEGAGATVTTVGTEEVRGVPTRHVTVDLDVAKALDQVDPARRTQLEDRLDRLGVSLADLAPVPAEAWIDDDGYVRRFSVSFDLAELSKVHPDADASGVVTQTIELYDFDEPVTVTVPPASEVTELDLAKVFGSGKGPGD